MAAPSKKKFHNRKSKDGLNPKKTPMKFSNRKKHDNEAAAAPEPTLMQFQDDAPDFPRGGRNVLSREEEEEIRAEVDAEFEAEQRNTKNKKRPRKSNKIEDDLGSLFGDGIGGKLPKFANRITQKNISPGMKLWGVIIEINSKDLVISLPGGLRGFARVEEASDLFLEKGIRDQDHESTSLHSIYFVGQLVSCIVLRVDDDKQEGKGKKKIWLSLRLGLLYKGFTLEAVQDGMVMTAYVKSIEDHGYILNFGLSSFSGFLPRKSQEDGLEIKMSIGQLVQGIVKNIDRTRGVVYLNANPDLVSKSVVKDVKGLSIDLLVPGMLVNARVHSHIRNGIMLSFLTYFTGTVDIFHLQNSLPNATWKSDYHENKKVNARILFIDPSTRAVGLTINPHLVHNKAPPSHVKTGAIYDNSRIVRVDKGFGLLLDVPSTPVSTPAYVNIIDVADEEVRKLEKKYKEGSHVRVRILGFRYLEGLATGSLKASVFEGPVFTHADVKPGMLVKGKVIAVENFGAIVQFSAGVKALCPLPHMSELDIVKPVKKFKVGAELLFRVLGCKSKRITVTYKKTLVKSKLKILASCADATEGLVTHGWISKIENHGCAVRFYNGVQGFAHRSELGLEPGVEASSTYHVGQVVKCRIINAVPALRKINLSFVISPKSYPIGDDVPKLGTLVSGVVTRVTPSEVVINVNGGHHMGSIPNEHLADHQGHAALLKTLLKEKPGYKFDSLLVLDVDGNNFVLSAKYSLINSAKLIPSDISQVQSHTVVHGYICNSIETGYFVRFLGRLTGFASKTKATDEQKTRSSDSFYIGQSVRSHILNVNTEAARITVSLKQSLCFSTDTSLIQGYFLLEEKIVELRMSDSNSSDFKWTEKLNIGIVIEGEVQELKEYGVVLSFKEHSDVVGFIANHQMGGRDVDVGSVVRAVVIDISKADCIVDLSLKSELISGGVQDGLDCLPSKKKRRREAHDDLELHQTVNAVIEIVKENYLVLSIPEYGHAIGYASICDYNTQKLPIKHFVNGQSVVATIDALPGPSTAGRLILLLKSLTEVTETSSSKRAKKRSSYSVGSLVEAEVTDINPLELRMKFGVGLHGRVHITEVTDDEYFMENPFLKFRVGQRLTARIVANGHQSSNGRKGHQWELSVKPSVIAGTWEEANDLLFDSFNSSVGKVVSGYVVKVDNEWVWLAVSRHVRAQLFLLDSSCEPSELQEFQNRFNVGKAVSGSVMSINAEKKLLRLTLRQPCVICRAPSNDDIKIDGIGNTNSNDDGTNHITEGDIIGGRIARVLPGVGGLLVQIAPRLYGKVHFTELTDKLITNPLNGYHEGQFVKCKVLEISLSFKGTKHVDLSLRGSLVNNRSENPVGVDDEVDCHNLRFEKIEDLCSNMDVQGYVKNVSSKGCFIMLSRKIDAKVLLSNLSDGYIEKPENEFPVGKLISGKVLSVEPSSMRVELTLKTGIRRVSKSEIGDISKLHVGDVTSGRVRRIEPYGLFITLDNTNMVGLCHISELSDSHVENIGSKFRAGERVVAKIIKVDKEKNRISLGMKDSYIGNYTTDHVTPDHGIDGDIDGHGAVSDYSVLHNGDLPTSEIHGEHEDGDLPVLSHVDSRASVPPLEVNLDDMEEPDFEVAAAVTKEKGDEHKIAEKNKSREKKKAKEKREQEIRAAEERLLEQDIPRTVDEFEKLVRSSPSSSFVWIKYMAFLLSMADVEKARSIAERALQTINFREEGEKLNIWVAYLNLENEYGSPPEEAVIKMFQRALQYCDPKKLHLSLLGVYERSNQQKLANELLDRMTKKFKSSCKVWLKRVESFLKQGKDGVQSVVNRALLSLPRNKHIKFISQSAILEFKCGVPDRGRSMFEGILREYPKRTDLWSIYLDQEIRLADAEVIRALFERATCLSLPPKKMKFLFKKYLEYEKSCGDEEQIEYVKRKAMEYVESSPS